MMMTERLLVGTRKGLFMLESDTRDAGANLAIVDMAFEAIPVVAATVDGRDGAIYVGLQHGHFGPKLHRSDDGGRTFVEIASPALPADAVAAHDVDAIRGDQRPASVQLLWSIEPGHAAEPGVLWCGTIPGALFRSDDRGERWTLVRSLWDEPSRTRWFGGGYDDPGVHSIAVDPRGAGRVLVGVSCGGAWRTVDGGSSWEVASVGMQAGYMPPELAGDPTIQDPHRIVRSPQDPDVLWAQHHNGIFRSTDNAVSWNEVVEAGPSTFGFALATDPHDANTAWFVPATSDEVRIPVGGAFVVTRTRDGGRTFDVLSDGLPQTHAYHLVYRHGLDVDSTGQRLAIGSTTGSLWGSADAGDHFVTVSTALPPINLVRWVRAGD
jgi:hypothetical protein